MLLFVERLTVAAFLLLVSWAAIALLLWLPDVDVFTSPLSKAAMILCKMSTAALAVVTFLGAGKAIVDGGE